MTRVNFSIRQLKVSSVTETVVQLSQTDSAAQKQTELVVPYSPNDLFAKLCIIVYDASVDMLQSFSLNWEKQYSVITSSGDLRFYLGTVITTKTAPLIDLMENSRIVQLSRNYH